MVTKKPTGQPTRQPTAAPSVHRSPIPSGQPTRQPSRRPSHCPSRQPTRRPTSQPTRYILPPLVGGSYYRRLLIYLLDVVTTRSRHFQHVLLTNNTNTHPPLTLATHPLHPPLSAPSQDVCMEKLKQCLNCPIVPMYPICESYGQYTCFYATGPPPTPAATTTPTLPVITDDAIHSPANTLVEVRQVVGGLSMELANSTAFAAAFRQAVVTVVSPYAGHSSLLSPHTSLLTTPQSSLPPTLHISLLTPHFTSPHTSVLTPHNLSVQISSQYEHYPSQYLLTTPLPPLSLPPFLSLLLSTITAAVTYFQITKVVAITPPPVPAPVATVAPTTTATNRAPITNALSSTITTALSAAADAVSSQLAVAVTYKFAAASTSFAVVSQSLSSAVGRWVIGRPSRQSTPSIHLRTFITPCQRLRSRSRHPCNRLCQYTLSIDFVKKPCQCML